MIDNLKLEKNFISVVVYIQNHEKYIAEFVEKVSGVLTDNFEKYEMIFVNDFGTDNTTKIIKELFKDKSSMACTIINLSHEHKMERAMVAGQGIAIGDFVYEFDMPVIDYKVEEIMHLYRECLKGFDIVSASPSMKKSTSKLFYKTFQRYSPNNVMLNSERFRILSRRGINRINNISETIPYRKAVYFNCGLKAKNVIFQPINVEGIKVSDRTFNEKVDFAIDNFLFFTNIGWKVSALMSILMIVFSIGIGTYTFATWIINQNVASGWTTIMMFLAISFSGLFTIMTIAIKYLSLILFVNTNKQDYIFESVEKVK